MMSRNMHGNTTVDVYVQNGGVRELFGSCNARPFTEVVPFIRKMFRRIGVEWSDVSCYLHNDIIADYVRNEIVPDSKNRFMDWFGYFIDIEVHPGGRVCPPP